MLDTHLKHFGDGGELLCSYLSRQTGNDLVVSGASLKSALMNPAHLLELVDFLIGVAFYREEPTFFHVNVDVEALEYHYLRKEEDCAVNLAGTIKIDMAKWLSSLSGFDYEWNVCLIDSFSRMVGTGFEWPRDEDDFKECVASHSGQFVVGLKEQIPRYLGYCSFTEDEDTRIAIEFVVKRFTA